MSSSFKLRSGNSVPFKQMGASPLKAEGPTGAGDRAPMVGSARRGRGYEKSSAAQMKGSPTKQIQHVLKGIKYLTKYGKKGFAKLKNWGKETKKVTPKKVKYEKPIPTSETYIGKNRRLHPQSREMVYPTHSGPKTTNPNFISNQANWLKQTQKYWLGK